MDALLGSLNNPVVLLVVQLAFGLLVKRLPALANVPNKLIPVLNALLAILIKLGGPGVAGAGVFGWIAPRLGDIVLQSLLQTALATGVHSSAKNVWQNIKQVALQSVAKGQ
jgi:hypothetical protein